MLNRVGKNGCAISCKKGRPLFPELYKLIIAILPTLALLILAACSGSESSFTLNDETRQRTIEYQVWLPEAEGKRPLVLFSHGSGGDYRNYLWFIDALVVDGYVIAALNHPGDTARDSTDQGIVRVWDRPQDMSLLLTEILKRPEWRGRVDEGRIGVAGHSSGGFTALSMAGALFNPQLMTDYCNSAERGPDCDLVAERIVVDYSGASRSYKDDRVRAVVAMSPALGAGVERSSLNAIDVPVSVITTLDDELLLPEKNALYYAREIPNARLVTFPKGGHFLFVECNFATHVADWFIPQYDLCEGVEDLDEAALRRKIAEQTAQFLDGALR